MRGVLPYVLFALTLVVCAGAVVAEIQRRALDPPHSTLTADILFIALVVGGVGLLVARARPRNVVGWIFLISGLEWAVWGTLNDQVRAVLLDGAPDVLGAALLLEWVGRWSWVPVVMPAVLFAPMFFPDGRLLSPRWWPLPVAGLASALATTAGIAFSPGDYPSSGVPGLANPFGIDAPWVGVLSTAGFATMVAAVAAPQ